MDFYGISPKDGQEDVASTKEEMIELFNLLKPKPASHPLIRIGGNRDGSYLVPDDLNGISACFSPGVNNFKYFEDYLSDTYGIDSHMCDFSSDEAKFRTPLKAGKQTFQKKWLDTATSGDSISLDDWVKEKSPKGDLLLQIDIEGAEYRNLLAVSDKVLRRFRIVVIEVHGLKWMAHQQIIRSALLPFYKRLDKFFVNVHAHPNNCCREFRIPGTDISVPDIIEITYHRKDRVKSPTYPPLIPHPLDITKNVESNSLMFLGDNWLENGRPLESKVKMLEDRLTDLTQACEDQNRLLARSLQTLSEKTASVKILREVATGRPFSLSSAFGAKAGKVAAAPKYFFHTRIGRNQSITIDLGSVCAVEKIEISNRTDGFFDRAKFLFAILSEDKNAAGGQVFSINTPPDFVSGKERFSETVFPPTQARFVTITSPIDTALHFSDLKIFAAS